VAREAWSTERLQPPGLRVLVADAAGDGAGEPRSIRILPQKVYLVAIQRSKLACCM
jgi:hypothetical protein